MDRPLRDVASSLTLDSASTIVDGALEAARAENLLPLAVAVLDSGGHPVAFKREDGCGLLRVEIAQAKARGALGMGISSRTIAQRLSNRPNFITAVVAASGGEFVPVPGGVLVLEHARRQAAPETAGSLVRVRDVTSGSSALAFYELNM